MRGCRLSVFMQKDRTNRADLMHQLLPKDFDAQVETIQKIQQVFGYDSRGKTQITEWHNRFKHGPS